MLERFVGRLHFTGLYRFRLNFMGRFVTKCFTVELTMILTCRPKTVEGVWGGGGREPPLIANYKNQLTIENGQVQLSPMFNI